MHPITHCRRPVNVHASKLRWIAQRWQRGLTQVEGLIALAVVAVVLGAALPSFEQARERRHVEGVAAQVRTTVLHARSLAISQDRTVRLRVETSTAGSCYVVHTGPANACTCLAGSNTGGDAVCSAAGRSFHSLFLQRTGPVAMSANVSSMLFDPTTGTTSPTGTISIQGRSGSELRQIVSIMGRVRTCSAGVRLSGYAAC
jgi:type IV fimbrial biogenesis protein FimT